MVISYAGKRMTASCMRNFSLTPAAEGYAADMCEAALKAACMFKRHTDRVLQAESRLCQKSEVTVLIKVQA